MISDVLCEAVAEVNRYLTDDAFEGLYEGAMRARIERLRDEMEAVRCALDVPAFDLAEMIVQTGGTVRLQRVSE